MLSLYVKLFNKTLDSGVMPSEWVVCMIIPICKNKGDTHDVNNYRDITLLSCLGKLSSSVLNERLTEYSNTISVINEAQAGFRHKYSTPNHIFLLKCVTDLFSWKNKFCLFVDYQKATDLVWREASERESEWEDTACDKKNMYSNIKFCVMLNSEKSDSFMSSMAVRQGKNLSPLLFAFCVNDSENKLLQYNCSFLDFGHALINSYLKLLVLMYADDTMVLCDKEEGMQQGLVALFTYCNEWKLKLNYNKTKIVVFSWGRAK